LKTVGLVDGEFEKLVGQETIARVDKFSEARAAEVDGLRLILEKNYPGAIEKFQKADNIVDQYHNAYEIYRLLRRSLPDLQSKDPAVAANARKSTLEIILTKYPQKAPEEFVVSARKELVAGTVESAVSAAGPILRTVP
jgi:glutamyl-tRNA reductase